MNSHNNEWMMLVAWFDWVWACVDYLVFTENFYGRFFLVSFFSFRCNPCTVGTFLYFVVPLHSLSVSFSVIIFTKCVLCLLSVITADDAGDADDDEENDWWYSLTHSLSLAHTTTVKYYFGLRVNMFIDYRFQWGDDGGNFHNVFVVVCFCWILYVKILDFLILRIFAKGWICRFHYFYLNSKFN